MTKNKKMRPEALLHNEEN